MRYTLLVGLALILLITAGSLAACGSAGGSGSVSHATVLLPKPTDSSIITQPAQIQGVWQVYSTHCTPGYMIIRDNGTYTWSCQTDGSNGVSGKYHFSNGKFLILNDICGAEGQYRVNASEPAADPRTLTFRVIKDSCDLDVRTLTAQEAVWVSGLP